MKLVIDYRYLRFCDLFVEPHEKIAKKIKELSPTNLSASTEGLNSFPTKKIVEERKPFQFNLMLIA